MPTVLQTTCHQTPSPPNAVLRPLQQVTTARLGLRALPSVTNVLDEYTSLHVAVTQARLRRGEPCVDVALRASGAAVNPPSQEAVLDPAILPRGSHSRYRRGGLPDRWTQRLLNERQSTSPR